MNQKFSKIHKEILKKSTNYKFLHNQINENGVQKIENTNLDLFTFLIKIIISQQISDLVAKKIWNKFCSLTNATNPTIKSINSKNDLLKIFENLGISERKKNYIFNIYDLIIKKSIPNIIHLPENIIREKLKKIKGIGNWSCDMVMIFFCMNQNILPENDLIVKKTLKKICLEERKKINFKNRFSPYLSIFSVHLWKMSKRIL